MTRFISKVHKMITNSRITLRKKRLSDAREDYAWQIDPELVRLDAAVVLDMTYQQYLAEYTFELCYPLSSRHEFGIDTLDGEHIGNCVYYNVDQAEGKAEVGIMIGNRQYWNQGYGMEAINALLDLVFTRTRLEKVYLTTLDWNARAQRCFQKCGFKDGGHVTRGEHKFLMMSLRREEWAQITSRAEQIEAEQAEPEMAGVDVDPEPPR
jgi:[ribosomal protein S5]-alanine N-acetyltransferase